MFHIPRAGEIWEFKLPNRRKTVKMIDYVQFEWHEGKNGEKRRLPRVHWKRQPKGRYTSLRVKWLLKYGRLLKEART